MLVKPILLHLSILLLLAAGCADAGGDEVHTRAAPPFPADAAFGLVERQVAFGPRVPGTPGHAAQLEWMSNLLRESADTLIVQRFRQPLSSGDTLEMANLFARFQPALADRVLLVAHWDTRPQADNDPVPANRSQPIPGANDGGSGVAVLLELARLMAGRPPPIGVDILLTDGEDFGPGSDDMYLGARYFAANLPPGYSPLYGVLIDLVGDKSPRFPVEGYSSHYAPEVVARVWDLARELGYGDVFPSSSGGHINDDHVPLNEAGIRTIDIIDFDYGPGNRYWHSLQDVPANMSAESLGIVGSVLAELIYRGG